MYIDTSSLRIWLIEYPTTFPFLVITLQDGSWRGLLAVAERFKLDGWRRISSPGVAFGGALYAAPPVAHGPQNFGPCG
jgi:hypothetical protein